MGASAFGYKHRMKNLFTVPAKKLLKSNPVELRHIVDEFIRWRYHSPTYFFSLSSNGQEVFHLEPGSLKQRLLQVLGNQYSTKLVNVKRKQIT